MVLIEFMPGQFVDANRIDYLNVSGKQVCFTLSGGNDAFYKVDPEMADIFLNHLQSISTNKTNVSQSWYNNQQSI